MVNFTFTLPLPGVNYVTITTAGCKDWERVLFQHWFLKAKDNTVHHDSPPLPRCEPHTYRIQKGTVNTTTKLSVTEPSTDKPQSMHRRTDNISLHNYFIRSGIIFCYQRKNLQIPKSVCIITSIFIFVIYARVGIFGLCQLKQLLPFPPPPQSQHVYPTRASLRHNISINWSAESVKLNGRTVRPSPIVFAIQCKIGTHLTLSLKADSHIACRAHAVPCHVVPLRV
jgi:hypothetical protein